MPRLVVPELLGDAMGVALGIRFAEVGTTRNQDPPEHKKALHLAKATGATLVIAKLDRLSQNAAFLLTLRNSGVKFATVDLPEANDLTVGIMALVAQAEREAISKRTGEAPAVARRRGVRLGNANGVAAGVLFALSPVTLRLFRGVNIAIFALPPIAIASILVLTPSGMAPRVTLAALGSACRR